MERTTDFLSEAITIYGAGEVRRQMEQYGLTPQEMVEADAERRQNIFDSFDFYSIPDLTGEERTPPEFIVSGMIPCGMTFISGAPKIRKSFLALQMAAAVATGTPFLGHATTQCDVAYLDLEGSKSRSASRSDSMTTQVPRNVHISHRVKGRIADGSLVEDLRLLHKDKPAIRLIIIDTYSRARGSYRAGGANAYDADVALLEPMQRMALEEKIAVVFVHHDKKGAGQATDSFERLSGTMGISGSADSVLNLVAEGKRFDGKATLEYNPRDAKGGEVALEFNECSCEWRVAVNATPDLRGNPVCAWIIQNVPPKGKEGKTAAYEEVFFGAYGLHSDNAGAEIRKQLEERKDALYSEFGVGVQMGVTTNSRRGIRIINLL